MKVVWAGPAEADIDRIWLFLAERSAEYADRVEATIGEGVEKLAHLPEIGRPRAKGGRELSFPDIQYRVGYFVREFDVLIATVRSTRENS